jgi:hypothetical protein
VKVLYTAEASATGDGRNGHVTSSDRLIDTDVRSPVELGGKGGATNPEQLFAAGYAACFHNALRRVARKAGADVTGSHVTARGRHRLSEPEPVRVERPLWTSRFRRLRATWPSRSSSRPTRSARTRYATRGNMEVVLTVVDSAEVTRMTGRSEVRP